MMWGTQHRVSTLLTTVGLPNRPTTGGNGGSGGGNIAQAEIYDPTTQTWALDATLHQPRSSQAAVRLKDGRVLVTGGLVGFTEIASAEIYTPAK